MQKVQGLPKNGRGKTNDANLPNIVGQVFSGYKLHTHIRSDLAYARIQGGWNRVCLPMGPCDRGMVGHAAGGRKDARLVKSALATLGFPISDTGAFHADRGPGFDDARIDELLEAFGL